jgi:resuscitation-promoting factor RpfA
VRAGDSLWSLTARDLGTQATPAQVAAGWPRLYAANRRAIGADPNLIHPGQRLVPPTSEGTSR